MNLNEYLSIRGQKSELARNIGVPAILVSQWSLGQRPVPITRCKAIEAATGGAVTCRDLRPDDWQKIWPELASPSVERSCCATESAVTSEGV